MFDALASKDIIPPEGIDVLELEAGMSCHALYKAKPYDAEIVAKGIVHQCSHHYSMPLEKAKEVECIT